MTRGKTFTYVPSAYSKLSTNAGTLQLREGEVEENILESEVEDHYRLAPTNTIYNPGRMSNLVNKRESFGFKMAPKRQDDDVFSQIEEDSEEQIEEVEPKVYYSLHKVDGVMRKRFEWDFE